jgi:hypothetical protein
VDSTRTVAWTAWSQNLDNSYVNCPTTISVEYALSELNHLYRSRQDNQIGKDLHEGILTGEQALDQLQKLHQSNGAMPKIVDADTFCSQAPPIPPEIIEGVLHQGSKMVLGGGSKSFKTWILLHMSLCVASGIPWLGYNATGGRVLYLNFELPEFAIARRISELSEAINLPVPSSLKLWNLRGHGTDAETILPTIAKSVKATLFSLIVIDPLYKLLGGKDENLSRDMSAIMNAIERLALDSGAAVGFGAHFTKGNPSLKEAIDRFSGSGVIGRDPDSILTFTPHKQGNAFSVDMILRNFPQQEPFVVRWNHPIMIIDAKLDPAHLKKPPGRPPTHEPDELLDCLHGSMTSSEWQQASDMPESTFYRLRKELLQQGKIFKSNLDSKWTRKP